MGSRSLLVVARSFVERRRSRGGLGVGRRGWLRYVDAQGEEGEGGHGGHIWNGVSNLSVAGAGSGGGASSAPPGNY